MKTPAGAKDVNTPLQLSRKPLGTVSNVSTPSINVHKLLKPQETKGKIVQNKVHKYPEIETFSPYNPLEFEKYSIPEDLLPLSNLELAGLACLTPVSCLPVEEPEMLTPLPDMSPVKMPKRSDCMDDFLQTLDDLTVDLPLESNSD